MEPTVAALGPRLTPGARSADAAIADISDGIVIRSIDGLQSGLNPIDGTLNVASSGAVIRGGSIDEPVHGFRVVTTLQHLLRHVVEVCCDEVHYPMRPVGTTIVVGAVPVRSGTS